MPLVLNHRPALHLRSPPAPTTATHVLFLRPPRNPPLQQRRLVSVPPSMSVPCLLLLIHLPKMLPKGLFARRRQKELHRHIRAKSHVDLRARSYDDSRSTCLHQTSSQNARQTLDLNDRCLPRNRTSRYITRPPSGRFLVHSASSDQMGARLVPRPRRMRYAQDPSARRYSR